MSAALYIFLLIGISHWAAHILQCKSCREVIWNNMSFLLEGAVEIFGWPIHAAQYAYAAVSSRPTKEDLRAEIERVAKGAADSLFDKISQARAQGHEVLEIRQEPGESDDAFHDRIGKTMREHIEKVKADKAKGGSNGPQSSDCT